MQRALLEYLERGCLEPHLETVRELYRERRDTMLAGLSRHLPTDAQWTTPQGGLCLWLTLPERISTTRLYLTAIDHGVAFAVGSVLFPQNPSPSSLRLNFAAHPPSQIEEGLRRLGRAVREELATFRKEASPPARERAAAIRRKERSLCET